MQPHPPQPVQDPRIGMVLQERYRILRKLGDGGMGAVYEGEHVLIRKPVAIKILHSQFAQNPEIVARFQREAEAATAIGHPNIVEVTDMGRFPDGTAFMVLELLRGRDWSHDIEREGPQSLGKVVHIVSQVCDALSAAHAKGIVHRDLKPENIFLIERAGDPNFAKVLDFGISKIADERAENRSLTRTGTALGTPYYMSPEQCQGRKDLDPRADVYSLGVILFQALTHQYPFDDESYPMLVLKICTEPPPPLAAYRPDLPPDVYAIVSRMLAKDREHRFASCEEVKAALAPFRGVHDAPVRVADAPSTASIGPSVLEHRVSGPVAAPSGTPYPASPVHGSVPEASAMPGRRSSGVLWVLVGFFAILALGGGALGTLFALGVLGAGGRPEPVASGEARRATEGAAPVRVERLDPAPGVVLAPSALPPAADVPEALPPALSVPSTPPAPSTVRLRFEVTGPPTAEIFVDDVPYGPTPLEIEVERDPPLAPGESPRLHRVEARAEGWQTATLNIAFAAGGTRTIPMQRAGGARPSSVARPTPQPLAPSSPGGGYRPPPPPPTAPRGLAPAPTRPRSGGPIVDGRSIF